jgi:anti-sigma factor RsiW
MTHDRQHNPNPSQRDSHTELPFNWDNVSDLDARRPDPEMIDIGALIDDELAFADRARVEAHIASNLDSQRNYRQLARLSRELKRMPVPVSSISPEELATRTIAAAQERKQHKRRLWSSWGGTAIAALFVATVSFSSHLRSDNPVPEVATTPVPTLGADRSVSLSSVTEKKASTIDKTESPLISRALFVE